MGLQQGASGQGQGLTRTVMGRCLGHIPLPETRLPCQPHSPNPSTRRMRNRARRCRALMVAETWNAEGGGAGPLEASVPGVPGPKGGPSSLSLSPPPNPSQVPHGLACASLSN